MSTTKLKKFITLCKPFYIKNIAYKTGHRPVDNFCKKIEKTKKNKNKEKTI
jgi:hypothetical protein